MKILPVVATLTLALATTSALADGPGDALQRLFDDERDFLWRADPLAATYDGIHDYDDRLPSVTPADQQRRVEADREFLRRLRAIDRAALGPQEQVSYDLFDFMVTQRLALAGHHEWRMPLTSDSGFHADVLFLHELANPRSTSDYERYIARLRDLPRYFDENIANMRQGLRDGFTLPAEVLPGISTVVAAEQFARPEDSPFFEPSYMIWPSGKGSFMKRYGVTPSDAIGFIKLFGLQMRGRGTA